MHLALVKSLIATLVLLWLYPDGTFFNTADSAEEKLLNGVRTVDNDMCKLLPTGNVVFFETGHPIVFFNGMTVVNGEWIAKRLLTGERLKTKEDVDSSSRSVGQGNEDRLRLLHLEVSNRAALPGGSNGVFIASLADGTTYGTIRSLNIDSSGTIVSIVPRGILQGFAGVGDYDGNRIANAKLAAARSQGVLKDDPGRLLYQVEQSTIQALKSDKVQGPVDEIAIRTGQKPVWLHKKSS
jgi:hypothetical protein